MMTANSASVTRTGRWAEASACSSLFFNLSASDMGEIAMQRLLGTAFLETLVSCEAVALQHASAWLEEVEEAEVEEDAWLLLWEPSNLTRSEREGHL